MRTPCSVKPIVPFLFLLLALPSLAQDPVKDEVVAALRAGNSKELARHFIPNVDLTVAGTGDVYSKAQAEQILRRFFDENPPVDMVIEHKGASKFGDQYYIGILRTRTGYFRVTFFLKKVTDVLQVKQLRIEEGRTDR
ncbi:MAG: DUF4783 domain-containing protein [Flavobacteriales bacterium]|nr:DUF4783 domain-containing protein [Flavobacteriales bacterium]MBP6698326.1 DUF4783 domain-containing protein [Flavobacteriales bacterium]